jgi:hypothetical protein
MCDDAVYRSDDAPYRDYTADDEEVSDLDLNSL